MKYRIRVVPKSPKTLIRSKKTNELSFGSSVRFIQILKQLFSMKTLPGIFRDKTMDDKLMYNIPKSNKKE